MGGGRRGRKGRLAPLDVPGSVETSPNNAEEDPTVKEIEKYCVEWRAGRVKPRWIFLIHGKPNGSEHQSTFRNGLGGACLIKSIAPILTATAAAATRASALHENSGLVVYERVAPFGRVIVRIHFFSTKSGGEKKRKEAMSGLR